MAKRRVGVRENGHRLHGSFTTQPKTVDSSWGNHHAGLAFHLTLLVAHAHEALSINVKKNQDLLDVMPVKGRTRPLRVYEVLAVHPKGEPPEKGG